jgi:hypothetical protein
MKRRCIGDGGRPSATALQEEVANHPEVRRSRAVRAERRGKRRAIECVRYDPMKAKTNEPQETCRKFLDDIETRLACGAWDEPGGNLSTAQAVSGIYAARAWVRLLYGTWEPVVSRETGSWSNDLRPALPGKAPSGRNRKGRIPDARHRGGPPGSSDEGSVMGLERSGRAIQVRTAVNHEAVRGAGDQAKVDLRLDGGSRMTGDCHVRFCESRGLRCPRPLTKHKKKPGKKRGSGR